MSDERSQILYLLFWCIVLVVVAIKTRPKKQRGGDLCSDAIIFHIVQKHRKSRAK